MLNIESYIKKVKDIENPETEVVLLSDVLKIISNEFEKEIKTLAGITSRIKETIEKL